MKIALAIAAAVLVALALRVVIEGRAALARGDAARDRGDVLEAIASYQTAARWYLPLAPHVDDAYARLRDLAADPGAAIPAWTAIRSAALATASLWTPHAGDLADANAALTRLAARDPRAGSGAGDTTEARESWYAERLARPTRPSLAVALLAGIGSVLGLGGALWLSRRRVRLYNA